MACVAQWSLWITEPISHPHSLWDGATVMILFFMSCFLLGYSLGDGKKKKELAIEPVLVPIPPKVILYGYSGVAGQCTDGPIGIAPDTIHDFVMVPEVPEPEATVAVEPEPESEDTVVPEPAAAIPDPTPPVAPEPPPHPDAGHPHFNPAAGRIIYD